MTHEEMKQALLDIQSELTERFPEAVGRLEQLAPHLATVAMVIDHIFEEAERAKAA